MFSIASGLGNVAITNILLENGANVNAQDNHNESPLIYG